jgi:hypothetical protein
MFGRGQFNAGVIIDPVPERAFDPEDINELNKFRQDIWPTVERMNEYAPQHSRIFKEVSNALKWRDKTKNHSTFFR